MNRYFSRVLAALAGAGLAVFLVGFFAQRVPPAASVPASPQKPAEEDPFYSLGSFLESAPEVVESLSGFTGSGFALAGALDYLEREGMKSFLEGRGEEVVAALEQIKESLQKMQEEKERVASGMRRMGGSFPGIALPFDPGALKKFLDEGIAWLKDPGGKRLAVFFQNPAEMRPAGGFLGSFGEALVSEKGVGSSTVRDVLEADKDFKPNVIPPRPLQNLVRRWRAADANWFFDFPVSAERVLAFLERSDMYRRNSISFAGAAAVSPRVVEDILRYTGPVTVEGIGEFTAENFLEKLQESVQRAQARGEEVPKQALGVLWEKLRGRMREFSEEQWRGIAEELRGWLARRDVMMYVRDASLEAFLKEYGFAGDVFGIPDDFEGDYLAIVDANIAGGKTDKVMRTDVRWESRISAEGIVRDEVRVTRTHEGGKSPYAWNRLPNQDYWQVFVPPHADLVEARGGAELALGKNRAAAGFEKDNVLRKIEETVQKMDAFPQFEVHEEAGKKVWSTVLSTPLEGMSEAELAYTRRLPAPLREGSVYTFIFEKQAGSVRSYRFTIRAPSGFRFRESRLPAWELVTDNPPGRMRVALTLEKM